MKTTPWNSSIEKLAQNISKKIYSPESIFAQRKIFLIYLLSNVRHRFYLNLLSHCYCWNDLNEILWNETFWEKHNNGFKNTFYQRFWFNQNRYIEYKQNKWMNFKLKYVILVTKFPHGIGSLSSVNLMHCTTHICRVCVNTPAN